jgi:hypothetical protein
LHFLQNLRLFVGRVQIRNVSSVQDGVHILDEHLVCDLRITENENDRFSFSASFQKQFFQIFAPLVDPVRSGDLDLVGVLFGYGRREACRAVPPGPAHSHQQQVPIGLRQHSQHPRHVLDSEFEHDQVHRRLRDHVVLVQVIIHLVGQVIQVGDLVVEFRLRVGFNVVAVEEVSDVGGAQSFPFRDQIGADFVHVLTKILVTGLAHDIEEQISVVFVDEAVVEDSVRLVDPQSDELVGVFHAIWRGQHDPVDHSGEVPQGKSVVGFGGGREELEDRLFVHVHGGAHTPLVHSRNRFFVPFGEVPVQNGRKDLGEGVVVERVDRDDLHVSEESFGDFVATSPRRTHRTNEILILFSPTRTIDFDTYHIDQLKNTRVLVEPVPVVQPLAQKLDRGLRPPHLLLWHPHVIHKQNARFAHRRTIHSSSALVKLRHDHLLRLQTHHQFDTSHRKKLPSWM